MTEANRPAQFDDSFVSEGMQHGPFPPPELDTETTYAQRVFEETGGDTVMYQICMLQEALINDKAEQKISEESFKENWDRLERAKVYRLVIDPFKKENPLLALKRHRK